MKSHNKAIAALAIAGATLAGGAAGAVIAGGAAGAQDAGTSTTAPAASPTTAPAATPPGAQAPTGQAPTGQAPAADPGATRPPKGQGPKDPSQGGHMANGKTETLLTGDELAKVTAAANQAAPGATVERAETDAEGDAFEAHIVQPDGTHATIKFAADFSVVKIETGPTK